MKAIVDQDTCTGCGLCAEICPVVFEMGDDDLAKVRVDPVPADAADDSSEAAESCPVEAITIKD